MDFCSGSGGLVATRTDEQERSVFVAEFEDVGRLAVEGCADCVEGAEADGLSLAGFQDGEVGLSDADASGQNIAIATLTPQKMWLA